MAAVCVQIPAIVKVPRSILTTALHRTTTQADRNAASAILLSYFPDAQKVPTVAIANAKNRKASAK